MGANEQLPVWEELNSKEKVSEASKSKFRNDLVKVLGDAEMPIPKNTEENETSYIDLKELIIRNLSRVSENDTDFTKISEELIGYLKIIKKFGDFDDFYTFGLDELIDSRGALLDDSRHSTDELLNRLLHNAQEMKNKYIEKIKKEEALEA